MGGLGQGSGGLGPGVGGLGPAQCAQDGKNSQFGLI